MLALARLLIVGFLVLTMLYVVLSVWSRRTRAGKLRREWEDTGRSGDADTFVEAGLRQYDGSVRRKLILLVYVIPVIVVGTIIYMTNYM